MSESNPNGANQYIPDPRQQLFLDNYLNPESETFSNCRQSALKAGYESGYADQIVARMPDWLLNKVKDTYLVDKAEKNLQELLGDEDKKIRADLTKFVLERLNKIKYSSKQEIEHSGDINEKIELDEDTVKLIDELIIKRKGII